MKNKVSNNFRKKLAAARHNARHAQNREAKLLGENAILKTELKAAARAIEFLKNKENN